MKAVKPSKTVKLPRSITTVWLRGVGTTAPLSGAAAGAGAAAAAGLVASAAGLVAGRAAGRGFERCARSDAGCVRLPDHVGRDRLALGVGEAARASAAARS